MPVPAGKQRVVGADLWCVARWNAQAKRWRSRRLQTCLTMSRTLPASCVRSSCSGCCGIQVSWSWGLGRGGRWRCLLWDRTKSHNGGSWIAINVASFPTIFSQTLSRSSTSCCLRRRTTLKTFTLCLSSWRPTSTRSVVVGLGGKVVWGIQFVLTLGVGSAQREKRGW